jgi:hypothetical protein
MMWIIAIPVALIVFFILYTFVLVPSINKKFDQKNNALTDAFALSIKGKEDETRKAFLAGSELVRPIIEHLQDDTVHSIISCMEYREMKDFKKQLAMNLAAKILTKGPGVAFREGDNEDIYYLVVSQSHFYYLQFDRAGDFVQQMRFEKYLMQNIEVGVVTSKEIMVNAAIAKDSERFCFQFANKEYKFFFYNRLYTHPKSKMIVDKDVAHAQINYLFAEPFKLFVAPYRTPS